MTKTRGMVRYSIVTITKNNPQGFKKTQASVQAQTYSNYEWIVIDGDKEPDSGIYDAMNKGIERASGEYIVFMNAGDEFADEDILDRLSHFDADFIYGDAIEGGRVKQSKHHAQMKGGMITHHQSMVYRRSLLKTLRYNLDYKIAGDYDLTLRFLSLSNCFYFVNFPICIFECGGVSQKNAGKARIEEVCARQALGIKAPLTPYRQWAAQIIKRCCPWLYLKLRTVTNQ